MKSGWSLIILALFMASFFSGCVNNQDSSGSRGLLQAKQSFDAGNYNESLAIYENLTLKQPAILRLGLEKQRLF